VSIEFIDRTIVYRDVVVTGNEEGYLASLVELHLMHTRTRAQRRSGKKQGKQRKLSHVYERPDSFVRLREASKVYCTIIKTRCAAAYHAHYFCT
jgi:hypothetical protein